MDGFRLTDRDREILRALAVFVRLFCLRQLAEFWFGDDRANARRRLSQLIMQGLVARLPVRARPLPTLEQPVISWNPGEPAPDFAQAAYRMRSRWIRRPVKTLSAYIATERTARMFGGRGGGELKNGFQATHDLGVAQVWLQLAESNPAWAEAWRGEDVMAHTRRGQKLPDGFIVNKSNDVVCVFEFGGAYDQQRVREFHDDCHDRRLPYRMW